MSSLNFSNVFSYMNEQYPAGDSTSNGNDILQELGLNLNQPDESDLSDFEIPGISNNPQVRTL